MWRAAECGNQVGCSRVGVVFGGQVGLVMDSGMIELLVALAELFLGFWIWNFQINYFWNLDKIRNVGKDSWKGFCCRRASIVQVFI